ncbi:gamma-glutamylcyclotransferase family protein [Methanococcoides sp. FTZ1]|uniref:gamma-glutamylcyclotransferase family protein n=1 Tax=Methanococcoides sp. FTZ1 TaxID=3439061 RepID=UPI003F854149
MSLLFVYGTLKKGCCNHHLLGDSTFVCEASTATEFRMLDLEYFPGVVMGEPGSKISGELYNADNELLKVLDEFEGKWFCRKNVLLDNGSETWMYFLSPAAPCEKYPVISSGKWKDHPVNENRY